MVVSVVMLAVMLMLALAPLCCLKAIAKATVADFQSFWPMYASGSFTYQWKLFPLNPQAFFLINYSMSTGQSADYPL